MFFFLKKKLVIIEKKKNYYFLIFYFIIIFFLNKYKLFQKPNHKFIFFIQSPFFISFDYKFYK